MQTPDPSFTEWLIPEPTPESPLLSVHLPKTAGTSFRVMLEHAFGRNLIFCYHNEMCDPVLAPFLERRSLTEEESRTIAEHCRTNDVRCIHGHYWLSTYHDVFQRPSVITFVRDPIDRIASEYWFQVTSHNIRHTPAGYKAYTGEFSFEDYMRWTARIQTYRNYGLEAYFDHFDFIGVTERFDESIAILKAKAPWLELPEPQWLNQNREAHANEIDSELRAELLELAHSDVAIYRRAVKRLEQSLCLLRNV